MPRLLDVFDGVETWFEKEPGSKRITLHTRQNVDEILRNNAEDRSVGVRTALGRRVARVPVTIIGKWLDEAGISQAEFWRQWTPKERRRWLARHLNDSDYQKFRTVDEKI